MSECTRSDVLGQLFDLTGAPLASFMSDGSKIEISGKSFEFALEGEILQLSCRVSDYLPKALLKARGLVASQLAKRESDEAAVAKKIAEIMLLLEEGDEDSDELALDLSMLAGAKGHHSREITKLETTPITVKHDEEWETVSMQPGVVQKLSWFDKPVVWCPVVNSVQTSCRSVEVSIEAAQSQPAAAASDAFEIFPRTIQGNATGIEIVPFCKKLTSGIHTFKYVQDSIGGIARLRVGVTAAAKLMHAGPSVPRSTFSSAIGVIVKMVVDADKGTVAFIRHRDGHRLANFHSLPRGLVPFAIVGKGTQLTLLNHQ